MTKINKLLLTIFIVLLTGSGCVYYNTFFLAKKHYKHADKIREKSESETIPEEAKSSYNITIEKASKVLAFYPTSKYVDDALFLLGMSLLWTDEPVKSATKFEELLGSFPDSKFADEAQYWRSIAWMKAGEFEKAESAFELIKEDNEDYAERAAFMIAESYYEQDDYVSAELEYEKFIEEYPKSSLVSLAAFRLMDIAYQFTRYERVIELEEFINPNDLNDTQWFTANMRIGEAYIELARLDDALKHFRKMKKNRSFANQMGDIEVRIGRIFYERDDTTRAAETWREVGKRFPYTNASAWAFYYLGVMSFNAGNLELALEMFEKSQSEARGTEIAAISRERADAIRKIIEMRIALSDSTDSLRNPAEIRMELAEMYVLKLDQPDSAINQYRRLLDEMPKSELAPKAMYSLGWTYANSKEDWDTADSVYASLLKKHADTDYAIGAVDYFQSRGAALDSTEVRSVGYYFVNAEEYLFTYNNPEKALETYQKVIRDYPESYLVPKAMLAVAYIYVEYMNESSKAEKVYSAISAEYPGTSYDSLAQIRLGQRDIEFEDERPKPSDSLLAEFKRRDEDHDERRKPGELTQKERDSLLAGDLPPLRLYPVEPLELEYPEQEWSTQLRGKVTRLKIFVDAFCKVDRVEILASCGNEIIDRAIKEAMLEAEFDPEKLDVTKRNNWYLYEVRVRRPKSAEYRRY
ncbi:MAG: tetratricopeptide repeat protein [Candidatus Zixiibacteriota bacterium]